MMPITQENLEIRKLKNIYHKTIKIYGPPGTGKTTTLVEKVVRKHLAKGVDPEQIAFISFTNKAVNTARKRTLEAFPKFSDKQFSRFQTLHKYCRRYFDENIFDIKECMIDFALEETIIKHTDKRLDDEGFIYKDWSLSIYDKSRNMMRPPIDVYKEESYKEDNIDLFLKKITAYESFKKANPQNPLIDFTDMIERAIDEITFPPIQVLILDEAQDFTPLQWSVIYKIVENVKRVYLAGDDDQAIYKWNGADPKYFTTYFPGRKVVLRQTYRFGSNIHNFSQMIRKDITDSIEKEFRANPNKTGQIKRYLSFKEIDFTKYHGSWFFLARVNKVVNQLRMMAKQEGLYFSDNKGNKSFNENEWLAIRAWTALTKGKSIQKKEVQAVYKYIRELKDASFREDHFWKDQSEYTEYNLEYLEKECGLYLPEDMKTKPWMHVLNRNFIPSRKLYFISLLKRYGQKTLDQSPKIIIDTIHSVKGDEADNVLLFNKCDYASDYNRKNKQERIDENRVMYTAITRAVDSVHILYAKDRYYYPIGKHYLTYQQEKIYHDRSKHV
jgi:superfamily I DNA/RNA helicase